MFKKLLSEMKKLEQGVHVPITLPLGCVDISA